MARGYADILRTVPKPAVLSESEKRVAFLDLIERFEKEAATQDGKPDKEHAIPSSRAIPRALSAKRAKAGRQKAKVKDAGDRAKIKAVFFKTRERYKTDNATAKHIADLAGWMKKEDNHLNLKAAYPTLKADDVCVIAGVKGSKK